MRYLKSTYSLVRTAKLIDTVDICSKAPAQFVRNDSAIAVVLLGVCYIT